MYCEKEAKELRRTLKKRWDEGDEQVDGRKENSRRLVEHAHGLHTNSGHETDNYQLILSIQERWMDVGQEKTVIYGAVDKTKKRKEAEASASSANGTSKLCQNVGANSWITIGGFLF